MRFMDPPGPSKLPAVPPKWATPGNHVWANALAKAAQRAALKQLLRSPFGLVEDIFGVTPLEMLYIPQTFTLGSGWTQGQTCNSRPVYGFVGSTGAPGFGFNQCFTGQALTPTAINPIWNTVIALGPPSTINRYAYVTTFWRPAGNTNPLTFVKAHTSAQLLPNFQMRAAAGNADPRPSPLPDTTRFIFGGKGPPTTQSTPHKRQPPKRNEKEKKVRTNKGVSGALSKVFHGLTEAADIWEALYDALPSHVRIKYREGKPITAYEKMIHVYANADKVDTAKALENLIANHYGDKVMGGLSAGAQKNSPRITGGIGRSLAWGL